MDIKTCKRSFSDWLEVVVGSPAWLLERAIETMAKAYRKFKGKGIAKKKKALLPGDNR